MQDNTRPTARRSLYRHAKIYQVKGSFKIAYLGGMQLALKMIGKKEEPVFH